MANKKVFATLVALFVLMLSGCQMPYSTAPEAIPTNIVIDESLFPDPLAAPDDPMSMVGSLATGSAIAMMQTAGTEIVATPEDGTPDPSVDPSVIMITALPDDATSTMPVFATIEVTTPPAPVVVSTPVPGSVPATYTLQGGEFPYCIARRFNVNPDELLSLNGLWDGGLYMPGLTLKIPQTGNPFPASRALRPHPATYTVASANETVNSIACLYGDVDPSAIASANGVAVGKALSIGTTLQIP
jgi:LysM repeat protein